MDNFTTCVPITLREEGGFVNNPADPGGATNKGITRADLARWRKRRTSVEDVLNLTDAEAEAIYRAWYWNTISGDALPLPVAMMVFDHGVNCGEALSARMLQAVVGADQDGDIGPQTLAAVGAMAPGAIVAALATRQANDYRGKADFHTFGVGWLNRLTRVETQALAWLAAPPSSGSAQSDAEDLNEAELERATAPEAAA